jgi:hypothetical protein
MGLLTTLLLRPQLRQAINEDLSRFGCEPLSDAKMSEAEEKLGDAGALRTLGLATCLRCRKAHKVSARCCKYVEYSG